MIPLSGKNYFWQAREKRRAQARSQNEGFQLPQLKLIWPRISQMKH
jgi:hypothetical protein